MANPNIERLLREIAKQQEAEETYLFNRIDKLEQLCCAMYEVIKSKNTWWDGTIKHTKLFGKCMEQLGLLEGEQND